MVQIWESCKPLQLISPVNNDHAMFIWKSTPVLSFSKKWSRYQNSGIILSLNGIALSNSCMNIRSLQVWHGLEYFFCKIAFILDCQLLCLLGCFMYNIEGAITFTILEKIKKGKTKNLNVLYLLKCINGYF